MYVSLALVLVFNIALLAFSPVFRGREERETLADVGCYRVLVLGRDEAAGLTDMMMLASFDLENASLSVMQIPRDTYLAYTQADYKKINGALSRLGGEKELCAFLSRVLGVSIDAYVSFDLEMPARAVDALGGIEIDVPFDMDYDDPYQDLSIHLKKGKQRLSGDEATHFIRYRSGYLRGDLGRMDAQKLFAAAFFRAFTENCDMGDLPKMAMLVAKYVRTDMRVDTMMALASALRRVSADDVRLLTLPGEEVQSAYSGAWYYIASSEGTRTVLAEHFGAEGAFDPDKSLTDMGRVSFREIYERNSIPEVFTVRELLGGKLQIENSQ